MFVITNWHVALQVYPRYLLHYIRADVGSIGWKYVPNSLHNFIQHMVLYFLSIDKVVLIFNSPLYFSTNTYLLSRPKILGP